MSPTVYDFEAELAFADIIGPVKPMIQRVNGSGVMDATNALFLREVFRDKTKDERIWVNFLKGDPKSVHPSQWSGKPATGKEMLLYDSAAKGLNSFYAVSTFIAKESTPAKRRIANFSRTHVIGLDDIGLGASAKIGPDKVKLAPTFVIETSRGNVQVGYVMSEPIAQRELADILQDALIHQGLGAERDPGQKNVTRYLRLPCGVNAKQKYVDELGHPWQHRLLIWEPERRYTHAEIVAAYGLELQRIRPRTDRPSTTSLSVHDDPFARKLDELGLTMGPPVDKGTAGTWLPVRCPNADMHTDGDVSGSAYRIGGGYKCHHGTCEHVGFSELQSSLALLYDVSDDELRAMNEELKRHRLYEDPSTDDYARTFLKAINRRRYQV